MRLPEADSMPARRAIASWPGEGLEAAVGAALAGRPGRVDGDVAELRTEAMRAAEQLAVDEDAAADAYLAKHADKILELARDSLPVLGERGEVRLVVGAHGQARQPRRHLVGHADVRPAEVRRPEQRPGLRLDEARERDRDTGRHQIALLDHLERLTRHPRQPVENGLRLRAPVVRVDAALVANRARQILDTDGQVVDVDLEPDRDDPVSELERLRRPANATDMLVLPRLAEQIELDQLTDEAGDGPSRQACLGRNTRARAGRAVGDLLEHDSEIRPSHGGLIGARVWPQWTLETHVRTGKFGRFEVDTHKPSVGFCMAIAQM